MGTCLDEVGAISDLFTEATQERFEKLVLEAFDVARATEPQIFWSGGETVAMFRAEVQIEALLPITKMFKVDSWRIFDRFVLTGATEHGTCYLMLFNTHQPKSHE